MRVLWLLNHTTLRQFEIAQLKDIGISEVYTPKSFPYDEGNLSASVDQSTDSTLSIPEDELLILNKQNWYEQPSEQAWSIVNKHFDIAIIGFFPEQMKSTILNFNGAIVLRVFGLAKGFSYSSLIYSILGPVWVDKIKALGKRFWFGSGYEHLQDEEEHFLKNRNCTLPVGLNGDIDESLWEGGTKKILFVCPRIGSSPYFNNIYKTFCSDFEGFDYTVGGAQPVEVDDKRVIGFVSKSEHEANMREHQLMFYHSTEPNHIHYHPFEAIQKGMPLLYMAGGMLDLMGGEKLPGRCKSIKEARKKAERIIAGDRKFIDSIRNTQKVLFRPMTSDYCSPIWKKEFGKVKEATQEKENKYPKKTPKLAVILPIEYGGGSLRGAKLITQAFFEGSQSDANNIEITFFHLDNKDLYEGEFEEFDTNISVSTFKWKELTAEQARRAMQLAGHSSWEPNSELYIVPDDEVNYFQDYDFWFVISDRISQPILPIKPFGFIVYDYLQRYTDVLSSIPDQSYINAVRSAELVIATTKFTEADLSQYAGVAQSKITCLPMLAPDFSNNESVKNKRGDYFIWTTNLGPHKNHVNTLEGIKIYYEELEGELDCHITGVDTKLLFKNNIPGLQELPKIRKSSKKLRAKLKLKAELRDEEYQTELSQAHFLLHTARVDNGTFSVIEAASLNVPSLSNEYPAMKEIDEQFDLGLKWVDANEPRNIAIKLKLMEELSFADCLKASIDLKGNSLETLSKRYWSTIKQWL